MTKFEALTYSSSVCYVGGPKELLITFQVLPTQTCTLLRQFWKELMRM